MTLDNARRRVDEAVEITIKHIEAATYSGTSYDEAVEALADTMSGYAELNGPGDSAKCYAVALCELASARERIAMFEELLDHLGD